MASPHAALQEEGTNPDWEQGLSYREISHSSFFSSYSHKLFPFSAAVGTTLVLNLKIKCALLHLCVVSVMGSVMGRCITVCASR